MQLVGTWVSAEHDGLDAQLDVVHAQVGRGAWDDAAVSFHEYVELLERVLRLEEDVLFPAARARLDKVIGIERLGAEHMLWREAVDVMADGLAARSAARFDAGYRLVQALVPDHHEFEEQVVYPLLDGALTSDERADFARRMATP